MPFISADRFSAYRKQNGLTQDQMGDLMGVTGKYVGMIERGDKQVEETSSLGLLFRLKEGKPLTPADLANSVLGDMLEANRDGAQRVRMVPVLGWAHAGEAESYEQLPDSWISSVPTECRDSKAFGVRLEGDSMESTGAVSFTDGDLLIAMPSEEPYSGCFVIARFAGDGVTFRRFETAGDVIRLIPLNDRYPVSEHTKAEFSWIYPVWGRWSQMWKR